MDTLRRARGSHPRGFTLMELITVVAIMGLLMTLIAVAVPSLMRRWRIRQTEALLATLGQSLNAYATDYNGVYPWYTNKGDRMREVRSDLRPAPSGDMPDDDDGLKGETVLYLALTSNVRKGPYYTGGQNWQVMRADDYGIFADPWGRPIHYYAIEDEDREATPLLESEGPRADEGGDADAKKDNIRSR